MSLESCLIAILGPSKTPVGGGILLENRRILTCAHVVNAALGRELLEVGEPGAQVVTVRFHGETSNATATVDPATWTNPPASRARGADRCLLRLNADPPGSASPARLCDFPHLSGRLFRAYGYPVGWPESDFAEGSVGGRTIEGLWMLRPTSLLASTKQPVFGSPHHVPGLISEGFSGAPVEIGGRVAGMVGEVRADPSEITAYMVPVGDFPESVKALAESFSNVVEEEYPHVRVMRRRYRESERAKPDTAAEFDIRVRFCQSYADVIEAQRGGTSSRGSNTPPGALESHSDDRDLTPEALARQLTMNDEKSGGLSTILLQAPGGAGKSSFLQRLLLAAPGESLVPFFLDFSRGESNERSDAVPARPLLEDWFTRFAGVGSPTDLLSLSQGGQTDKGFRPLLVIDGFNQAKRNWEEALERIAALASGELAGATIIIADRMIERGRDRGFRLATVPPLQRPAYTAALEHLHADEIIEEPVWVPILSSPLFLNILRDILRNQQTNLQPATPSRFSVLNQYFRKVCGFTAGELHVLSEAAYECYRRFGCTTVPRETFFGTLERCVDAARRVLADSTSASKPVADPASAVAGIREKVETQGLLNTLGGDAVEFRHQVLHDWLVALKVASCADGEEETLLRAASFDTLSLRAASPDGVELAVEALQEPDQLLVNIQGEVAQAGATGARIEESSPRRLFGNRMRPLTVTQFLTEVYDWNPWIVLECVISFDERLLPQPPIREWMRHAFYSLNLEKLFDLFLHTALRTERLRGDIARVADDLPYLNCQSHDVFIKAVKGALTGSGVKQEGESEVPSDEDGRRWLRLYTCDEIQDADLDNIWGDPLFGWTTANVIQRLGVREQKASDLIRLYRVSRATSDSAGRAASFRWRLVHALGRAPAETVKEFLLDVTFDALEERHVRYGAIRGALQVAVLSGDSATIDYVLDRIGADLGQLFSQSGTPVDPSIRHQLRRACALNDNCQHLTPDLRHTWLTSLLDRFNRILELGASLSDKAGLHNESPVWLEWQHAVRDVSQMQMDDSALRRARFVAALAKDPG